jgi:hypothetical protein
VATVVGFTRCDFSSSWEFDEKEAPCPYHLAKYMTLRHFEVLTYHLRLSDPNPPNYQDKFWEVQGMLAAWREIMADFFNPAWIT